MRLLIKGLLDKRVLFKNILIVSILLFILAFLSIVTAYQKNIAIVHRERVENRTITIQSKTEELDYIYKYNNKLEKVDYEDIENIEIIFKTVKDKDEFLEENEKYIENVSLYVASVDETSKNITIVFQGMSYLLLFACLILITIFNSNYLFSMRKDLALYRLLGISKVKLVFFVNLCLNLFYSIIFGVSYTVVYLCYYLVLKFNDLDYYNIFTFEYIVLIILILSLVLSTYISLKNGKKRNDLDILRF